jgi:hypothetical protein
MAAQKQQGQKGNPAGKRMSNEKRKAKRARSWLKNSRAKAVRIADAKVAFEMNEAFRAIGEPTPYELRRRGQRIMYEARKATR